MIRDGFNDVKKATAKETRKKAEMGERAFYAQKMPKLKDLNKAVSISTVATFVMISIAYAISALCFVASLLDSEVKYSVVEFVVWSCVFGALLVFLLVWFLILKPSNEKKIERYRLELERLSAQSIGKISAAATVYGREYVEKLADERSRERENAKREAERLVRSVDEKEVVQDENSQENQQNVVDGEQNKIKND